jgi:hypothetical protein
VGKWYTASIGEKANLRKDLVNWRGREFTDDELKGFDVKKLLGVPCMLSLTPNDKGKVRVTGIMKLPQGTTCPPQINPERLLLARARRVQPGGLRLASPTSGKPRSRSRRSGRTCRASPGR